MIECEPKSGPRVLHVGHSWGGGLARFIEDFVLADHEHESFVLEPFGTVSCYGLGHQLRRGTTVLWREPLEHPIAELRVTHPEYRNRLERLVEELEIDQIYVSSLIGHSMDVLRTGVPTTRIHHDYHPFCAAWFIVRDGICSTCTKADLEACVASNPWNRPRGSAEFYAQVREQLFEPPLDELRHVVPLGIVRDNLRRLDSRYESVEFAVIEHGVRLQRGACFGGAEDDRLLRVLILGSLTWNKGQERLERLFPKLRTIATTTFLGAGDGGSAFDGRWRARIEPAFPYEELADRLGQSRPDLVLFTSEVPETFSYTLSEAWCLGVPPVARAIGAHDVRIDDGATGFLFGPDDNDLLDCLVTLHHERDRLRQVAKTIESLPIRTPRDMVEEYHHTTTSSPAPIAGRDGA